eukprot:m.156587 g.156587  ORF g.156587 m.156587 type:complete len:436 (+) comp24693_c0_seq3:386-1693(+)
MTDTQKVYTATSTATATPTPKPKATSSDLVPDSYIPSPILPTRFKIHPTPLQLTHYHAALDLNNHNRKIMLQATHRQEFEVGFSDSCLREITILKTLHHEHVLRLFDVIIDDSDVLLTFEPVCYTLRDLIQRYARATNGEAQQRQRQGEGPLCLHHQRRGVLSFETERQTNNPLSLLPGSVKRKLLTELGNENEESDEDDESEDEETHEREHQNNDDQRFSPRAPFIHREPMFCRQCCGEGKQSANDFLPLIHQFLTGLAFLHASRVLHRDLKPLNLFVTEKGTLKIGNFETSRETSFPQRPLTPKVVTLWYRPPELLLGAKNYGPCLDIWGAGCIIAECYLGFPLFKSDSEIDQLFQIFRRRGTPNPQLWQAACSLPLYQLKFPQWPARSIAEQIPGLPAQLGTLLEIMLALDPKHRPSALDAVDQVFPLLSTG